MIPFAAINERLRALGWALLVCIFLGMAMLLPLCGCCIDPVVSADSAPAPDANTTDTVMCHVDEATQAYDQDAGAYAYCPPTGTVWTCSEASQLDGRCRWLGLGYLWCCPAN